MDFSISIYSVATAVILYNLALVLVWLLRRSKKFPQRYGVELMLLLTALGVIRLLLPLDSSAFYIVKSETVIPAVVTFLQIMPFEGAEICLWHMLLGIWALGGVLYLLRIIRSFVLDSRAREAFVPEENKLAEAAAKALGIGCPVVVSKQVPTPHVAGVFRPRIYLPPLELDEQQWQYVLRHEMQHIRSRDLVLKFLYFFLAAVFWWNPISNIFVGELDALLELRCDSKVTGKMDEQEKKEYLSTMLSVVRQTMRDKWARMELHAGFMSPLANAKQRFANVLEFDADGSRTARAALSAGMVLVFALSYFVIFQPSFYPPMEDMDDVVVVTEENSFILHTPEGEYHMYVGSEFYGIIPPEHLDGMPYCDLEIIEGS